MIIIFLGILGYTKPGDKYDAILPEVSSWNLDRRKKGSKKSNYSGGFTASVNKNDEYRFYSITWEALPENDFSSADTTTDMYEAVSKITSQKATISGLTTINIQPILMDIEAGTEAWIKVSDDTFMSITISSKYTSGSHTLSVNSPSYFEANVNSLIVLHKGRGLGLLSLASLAATGSAHMLRDFMGNLVKVIIQSPKYNALAGTDDFSQMYYDVKVDIDLTADTSSKSYQLTKGIKANTSNETLPRVSTISGASGSYDLSTFFIIEDNNYNILQYSKFISKTNYKLCTTTKISPIYGSGMPLLSLSRKIGVFRNYIATKNQLNMKFVGNGGQVIRDDAGDKNDIEFTLDVPEVVYGGDYVNSIEYGAWDEYKSDNTYIPGSYALSTDKHLYMSIKEGNKGKALTDANYWYAVKDGTPIIVRYVDKYYKLIADKAKDKSPGTESTVWTPYTISVNNMFVKCTDTLANNIKVGDTLIFVIQPYAYQSDTGKANSVSVLLSLPIVDGPIMSDIDINSQASFVKLSSLIPVDDKTIAGSLLGTAYDVKLDGKLKYYQNTQLASSLLTQPSGSEAVSYKTNFYQSRFNIEQLHNKLVSYLVLSTDSANATISNGTTNWIFSNGSPSSVQFDYARDQINIRASVSVSGSESTKSTLIQSFNTLSLDKKVYEAILDTTAKTITVNVYWMTIDKSTNDTGIIYKPDDPTASGLSVIKHKLTSTSSYTESIIASDANFELTSNSRIAFSSCTTYDAQPLGDAYIAKYFSVEDGTWT